MDSVARTTPGVAALRRLVDRGLATVAGFTPSDALHVLGRHHGWCWEAARLGAALLALEERNASARREADTPEADQWAHPRARAAAGGAGGARDALWRATPVSSSAHRDPSRSSWARWQPERPFSQLLDVRVGLARPLVAIGAPAAAYYGEVARRLGAVLNVPDHAQVCNAIGAAAGVVSESCELTVSQPVLNVFRVHDPAGSRDFNDPQAAIEEARRLARAYVLAAAQRSGARDPQVEITVSERRARTNTGDEYLAEATVVARATGVPVVSGAAGAKALAATPAGDAARHG